jgi:Recombinase
LRDIIEPIKRLSTRRIAAVLNERGVETARGGKWQSMTVARLLDRLGLAVGPARLFRLAPPGRENFP